MTRGHVDRIKNLERDLTAARAEIEKAKEILGELQEDRDELANQWRLAERELAALKSAIAKARRDVLGPNEGGR